MRHHLIALVAPWLVIGTAIPVKAAEPISLAKVTKWEIKYTPDSCQLLAAFGSGDDRVIFALSREEPGDAFDLQLYGKPLKYEGIAMPVELTFGPAGQPIKRGGVSLTANDKDKLPLVRLAGVRIDGWDDWKHPELRPAIAPAHETSVTWIGFKPARGKSYRLETGSLGAPLAAMRICTADLIKTWGYDPAVEDALTRNPMPLNSPATWLHSYDFPNQALLQGHNGLVRFRLDVDATGQPTGCRVLYRTNPDEFADLSCQLLIKRARFRAALDAAGKPVKSFYINNIRWVAGGEW